MEVAEEELEKELFGSEEEEEGTTEAAGTEDQSATPLPSVPSPHPSAPPAPTEEEEEEEEEEGADHDVILGLEEEDERHQPPRASRTGGVFGDSEEEENDDEEDAEMRRKEEPDEPEEEEEGEEEEDGANPASRRPDVPLQLQVPDIGLVETQANLFLAKLPNFLNIDATPFHPSTYTSAEPIPGDGEGESGSRSVRLLAENTVRWRLNPRDQAKESNARIIRWSDDSYSLLLGEELFDISRKDIASDHTYLLANHAGERLLQTQTQFTSSMTFKPHSMHSATHRKLTQAISSKHRKVTRTKLIASLDDPEQLKLAAEKAENEKLRARRRLEAKRKHMEYAMTAGYLEEGMGQRGSLGGSRKSPYPGGSGFPSDRQRLDEYDMDDGFVAASDEEVEYYEDGNGDDADEEEDSEGDRRRLLSAKNPGRQISDSSDDDEEGGEAGAAASSPSGKVTGKRLRIDDDEEDEEDEDEEEGQAK